VVGMHEACLNLLGPEQGLPTDAGQRLALATLTALRERIMGYQQETGHFYNLEATPAEGTSYRLAKLDTEQFHDIITSGSDVPYYTNSSQLPVNYTDDLFETLDLQDALQCLYTGGTVLHLYVGEQIESVGVSKQLLQRVLSSYSLPYVSLTPTFSTCEDHGYLVGEQPVCPVCGKEAEVWTRVVGYLRPVRDFHKGKREEYRQRKLYRVPEGFGREVI